MAESDRAPACRREEARPQRWRLVVWRRDAASGSHEAYRRVSFSSRAAACAWLERHVLAGRVTWFERERRCSVVVGPGGVTP